MYCQFLLAAQGNFTMTAMAETFKTMAHDKINRWTKETKLTPAILWEYSKHMVEKKPGYLICDDTIIEKEFGTDIELTGKHYSPSDGKYVNGINVTSMLWSDGNYHIPIDYRIYAPNLDGKTKNDHFKEMLRSAKDRGMQPRAVLFDSWYASNDNLKTITQYGWKWITELKKNRIINHQVRLENTEIPKEGLICHLRGYGWIKVIKRVIQNNHLGYLATSEISFSTDDISQGYAERWKVEEYHRGLKQTTGLEECQARTARIQRNHIFCCMIAFLALEFKRITEGVSWYEAKHSIVKDAIRTYLKSPTISFNFA
jgi:hypothetical protein